MRSGGWARSNAVGLLALFVALSGTALALERGSVRSKHVKDGAVKARDVDKRSVTVGGGRVGSARRALADGEERVLLTVPGLVRLEGECGDLAPGQADLRIINTSGATLDLFMLIHRGESNETFPLQRYSRVSPGGGDGSVGTLEGPETARYLVGRGKRVAVIDAAVLGQAGSGDSCGFLASYRASA